MSISRARATPLAFEIDTNFWVLRLNFDTVLALMSKLACASVLDIIFIVFPLVASIPFFVFSIFLYVLPMFLVFLFCIRDLSRVHIISFYLKIIYSQHRTGLTKTNNDNNDDEDDDNDEDDNDDDDNKTQNKQQK